MRLLGAACLGIVLIAWLGLPARAGAAGSEALAVFEVTPPDRPGALDYRYSIRVRFADPDGRPVAVARKQAREAFRYALHSDCQPQEPLTIAAVVWRGVGAEPETCTGAVLYADLDPACAYTLRIDLPPVSARAIRVVPSAALTARGEDGFVRFVRFCDRYTTGTLDLRTLDDAEERVGVDFRLRLAAPVLQRALGAQVLGWGLAADGMLAVERRPRRSHNQVDLELQLSWLRTYTLPALASGQRHVQAYGFQLVPAGIEADQGLQRIDYVFGPAVTFSVPGLDWPLLYWHRLIEMPRGFVPPTVHIGYRYLHRVRSGGDPLSDRRRLEVELLAVAPLLRPVDLLVRHRFFYDLSRERRRSHTSLTWRWYVGRATRTAVLLKLVHGALPPRYDDVDVASIGFQLGL